MWLLSLTAAIFALCRCPRPAGLIPGSQCVGRRVVSELLRASVCMDICFLLGKYLGVKWLYDTCILNFLRNCFPKWLYHFTFPPAVTSGNMTHS